MKKLFTLGDSHSSTIWGESWPDHLSKSLGYELYRSSSPGAGNSYYIEKLNYGLKEFQPDLVVVQLTEPSRIVLGMRGKTNTEDYNNPTEFKDLKCYTWNASDNQTNIKNLTGHQVNIDRFWSEYVSTSKWVDYKVCQDILTLSSLCKEHNTKVIFWSWYIPMRSIFLPSYKWLEEKVQWIDGCGSNIMNQYNQPRYSETDYHYGSVAHQVLTEKWLYPNIKSKLDL